MYVTWSELLYYRRNSASRMCITHHQTQDKQHTFRVLVTQRITRGLNWSHGWLPYISSIVIRVIIR